MIKTVIFDMDGVLIDSEKWWKDVQNEYLSGVISAWEPARMEGMQGRSIPDSYDVFKKEGIIAISKDEFLKAHDNIAERIYAEQCNLLPHVGEVLQHLTSSGILCALASSSPHAWITPMVDRFDIRKYFSAIVSADDIPEKSKPDPAIYLFTAKQLGVNPKDCIVIEDSKNGILSGKAAGMMVLALQTDDNKDQDTTSADHSITSLTEIYDYLV